MRDRAVSSFSLVIAASLVISFGGCGEAEGSTSGMATWTMTQGRALLRGIGNGSVPANGLSEGLSLGTEPRAVLLGTHYVGRPATSSFTLEALVFPDGRVRYLRLMSPHLGSDGLVGAEPPPPLAEWHQHIRYQVLEHQCNRFELVTRADWDSAYGPGGPTGPGGSEFSEDHLTYLPIRCEAAGPMRGGAHPAAEYSISVYTPTGRVSSSMTVTGESVHFSEAFVSGD